MECIYLCRILERVLLLLLLAPCRCLYEVIEHRCCIPDLLLNFLYHRVEYSLLGDIY